MKNFKDTFPHTNGVDFPDTEAVNSSGGGVKDGTHFNKDWANDWWGFAQAVLKSVSETPNGISESASSSQILDALQDGKAIDISGSAIVEVYYTLEPGTSSQYTMNWCVIGGILHFNFTSNFTLPAPVYVGSQEILIKYISGFLPVQSDNAPSMSTLTPHGYDVSQKFLGYETAGVGDTYFLKLWKLTDNGGESDIFDDNVLIRFNRGLNSVPYKI